MLKDLVEKSDNYRKKLQETQNQIGIMLVNWLRRFIPDIEFSLDGIGKTGYQTVFLIPHSYLSSYPLSRSEKNDGVSLYCVLKDIFDKHD